MNHPYAKGSGGGGGGGSNAKDNLFSGDAIEIVLGISEGPVQGIKGETIAEQLNNVFLDGTPILTKTGEKVFKDSQIILSYERGTPVTIDKDPEFGQTPIPYILGGNATPVNVGVPLEYNIPVTRIVPSLYRNQYNKIEVRILVSRLVEITDKGTKELGVSVKIEYKKVSETQWRSTLAYISGKTMSGGFVRSVDIYLQDTSEDYEIRVTMMHPSDPDNKVRELAFFTYELSNSLLVDGKPRREMHPGTAMVSLVAKIGENFNRLPNFTAVWRGIRCAIPSNYDPVTRTYDETSPWDGTFKVGKYWTNNPFWVAREILTNPRFGMARYNPTVMPDDYSFYEEAKYADTMRTVETGSGPIQIPMFTFNGVISKQLLGLELINYILGSAFAQAIEYSSGVIRVVSDRNNPAVMTVTPEMCAEMHEGVTFTYTSTDLKDRHNEISVTYVEPDIEWQPQFLGPFVDEEAQRVQGVNVYEFEAIGTTNQYEAEYKGYFNLITAQTETLTVSFNIPGYAIAWDIFDVIDIVDPNMDWGMSGRANRIEGDKVYLRQPMYFEEPGRYEFLLQTRNAQEVLYHFNIPAEGSYLVLTLETAVTHDIAKYPAFSIMRNGLNPGRAKPFRVVSITPMDGYPNLFAVTAVEVNRNKWGQALNRQLGEKVRYNFEMPKRPTGPANLRYLNHYVLPKDGGAQNIVTLVWDAPAGQFLGLSYVVQVAVDGGLFADLGFTRVNQFDLEVEPNRNYQIRIKQLYMDTELYSDILNYDLPEYSAVDFDPAKLQVNITGEYRGEDLYYSIQAIYNFSATASNTIDLIKAGKISGFKIDFYDMYQGRNLVKSITQTEETAVLLAADQYDARGKLARQMSIEVRLIDLQGNYFPSEALVASVQVNSLPAILNISAGATTRALSAVATLTHDLPRNMTLRWFLGNNADGSDRIEIANTKAIHGYTVEPNTSYFLWAQPVGPYGDGAMFPDGEGLSVQSDEDDALEGATSYMLTRSAGIIKRVSDGVFSPPTLTCSAIFQTGSGPVTPYAGRFKILKSANGQDWQEVTRSNLDQSDITIGIPVDANVLKIELYQAGGFSILLDQENCQVIEDGLSYDLKIESTNGTVFRPDQNLSTTLRARVFKNGKEITSELPASRFNWRRVSLVNLPPPNDDETWNFNFGLAKKEVIISVDELYSRASFFCDLIA